MSPCPASINEVLYFAAAITEKDRRLRQKGCQIPEREEYTDTLHNLTVKSLSDVVSA